MEERLPKGSIGGQAVIEGVMMKGKESYSVAVRKPDKKIDNPSSPIALSTSIRRMILGMYLQFQNPLYERGCSQAMT